jgi:SAM-dependent MidA family methyltransferase
MGESKLWQQAMPVKQLKMVIEESERQLDAVHQEVRATYDSVVVQAWREKVESLNAENARLTAELAAARGEFSWIWDEMGERRISTLSFDYGMNQIVAFDFDNNLVAQAETIKQIWEQIANGEFLD